MTASTSEPKELEIYLAQVQLSLHLEAFDSVRLSLIEGQVLLEGSVPSYEAKCKIERDALTEGYRVQNCLRIVPAVSPPLHPTLLHPSVSDEQRSLS